MMTGPEALEEVDLMLANGFDLGDALMALGRRYDTVRKLAARHGRSDLVDALSAWRSADADRLRRARGTFWH